jgi:hypothetical protein
LLVRRVPTGFGVSQCDREASTVRKLRPTRFYRVAKNLICNMGSFRNGELLIDSFGSHSRREVIVLDLRCASRAPPNS